MIQLKPGIPPSALNKPRKAADRRQNRSAKKTSSGLHFERVFSDAAVRPFDQIEWEHRTAEITDDSGQIIFKQENVEVPKNWSALATKIAVSKYFYGDIAHGPDPYKGGRESSVRQLILRVTRTITDWGIADGYFADAETAEIFYDELTWLCLNQYGAFNSPVWFNVGLHHVYGVGKNSTRGNWFYNPKIQKAERASTQYEYPQCSACFIQSVGDDMESIMDLRPHPRAGGRRKNCHRVRFGTHATTAFQDSCHHRLPKRGQSDPRDVGPRIARGENRLPP